MDPESVNGADVATLVDTVCTSRGWNKRMLAESLGVSPVTISRWISPGENSHAPRARHLKALRALAVNGPDRELYREVGVFVRRAGVASIADIRGLLAEEGRSVEDDDLRDVLFALADDGLVDFAWRL